MSQPCNNCIRGIAIDTKDVCTVCGGTGIKLDIPAKVEAVKKEVTKIAPKAKKLVHKKGK